MEKYSKVQKGKRNAPISKLLGSAGSENPRLALYKAYKQRLNDIHLKDTITSQVNLRKIILNNRELINFGSASYLGLDQNPEMIDATKKGTEKWGTHSGCSRIFSTHENHLELESDISRLVGAEQTMIFANVSQTHQGCLPALFGNSQSVIFLDRYAHTSLYLAAKLAESKGATIVNVDTLDLCDLEKKIQIHRFIKHKCLLIDGLYSMHGHFPPFKELASLAKQENMILYVDDAHGIGIIGENGGGVREKFELPFSHTLIVGSLQKGVSCFGGFISGNSEIIEHMKMINTSFIFSGTLQPGTVEASRKAIEIIRSEKGKILRSQLQNNIDYTKKQIKEQGWKLLSEKANGPIQSIIIGSDIKTFFAGRFLFEKGLYVNSVTFPAVPKGQGILRLSLNANHSQEDLEGLLESLNELKERFDNSNGFKDTWFYSKSLVKSFNSTSDQDYFA